MHLIKKLAIFSITLFIGLQGLLVQAAPTQGKEYTLVNPPQATETGKNIEVLEIFWYGCPHCFDLEPSLSTWVKKLPSDVTFRRMPAIFRDDWALSAKTFYAMDALGVVDKLNADVFNAIHVDGVDLKNENTLFDWMSKHGVDRKKFADAYSSFSVQSKVLRAKQLTREYGISGVPAIIVDGKYMTAPSMTGGHQGLFPVIDSLIARARTEHAGKK
ncbi:thiol:disulfide interchange protein DsbA/DsbL [Sulfurirhabdus autotrophica]|uniref:Thiol:disulfide interchange protein n=1 Tax=Sulfurirhabdus autotrophica TaxID=1706046 RepID=A0A4R3XX90_9PROT|nr:thiol:disulfide interchange protein DsbA/DsbL [Sulfurirhabdus autotrophica]TCV82213.1 thiol:disulfide interchange protein DsbA [Sulfurirhabdus autotrophica]